MKCIEEKLQNSILILDGAMGTMIQQEDLTAEDFGGEEYEGCNEYLVETRPDVILKFIKLILKLERILLKQIHLGQRILY